MSIRVLNVVIAIALAALVSIADRISAALPNIKAGSLRIWGEWFGKPYDNFHTIKTERLPVRPRRR